MRDRDGRHRLARVTAALALLPVVMATAPVAWSEEPLPAKAYVEGVPFVSWHEMRDAEFSGSDVVNPSLTAVAQMMYGYWGEDFVKRTQDKTDPESWTTQSGSEAGLADLKVLLARGIPVQVAPSTTPHAHRLYLTPKLCGMFKPVAFTQPHPASGALGEMISLGAVEELRAGSCGVGLNDSVILASKLLVGYDDERQVFVMHDPSFGPSLELGYEEFERMWRATEAKFWARHPETIPEDPPGRVEAVRARTVDDDAAVALFRAYGLEVIGDYRQAEAVLREVLGVEGLSRARRHQLLLELAVSLNETGRCTEAIEAARSANAEFDDYAIGHRVLAFLLACSGERAAKKEAKRENARAEKLCEDKTALRRVADELGHDFEVMGCKQERLGWYRP
jgi:hypothetical protein